MIRKYKWNVKILTTYTKPIDFFPLDYYFSDQSVLETCLLAMCFINALFLTPNLEINAYSIIFLQGVLLFTIDLTGMKGLPLTRPCCWHFTDELLNFKKWINLTIAKTDGLMIFCTTSNVFIITVSKQQCSCFLLSLSRFLSFILFKLVCFTDHHSEFKTVPYCFKKMSCNE